MLYLDGSASVTVNIFSGPVLTNFALVFLDAPGDDDIFIHLINTAGGFAGALWADFKFVNILGQQVFDLWGSPDGVTWAFLQELFL